MHDVSHIRGLLPHGHPMLLVDSVVAHDPGRSIEAVKAITICEPCYAGLDPRLPADRYAYPASLLLESFGQAAALLWLLSSNTDGVGATRILMLVAARDCRIEGCAMPGDVVRHVARVDHMLQDNVFVEGESYVGDRRIATIGSMMAVLRPRGALHGSDAVTAGVSTHP
jgi:3-hydroxyacyl-[acyl-carrier-protein] dehydratase